MMLSDLMSIESRLCVVPSSTFGGAVLNQLKIALINLLCLNKVTPKFINDNVKILVKLRGKINKTILHIMS